MFDFLGVADPRAGRRSPMDPEARQRQLFAIDAAGRPRAQPRASRRSISSRTSTGSIRAARSSSRTSSTASRRHSDAPARELPPRVPRLRGWSDPYYQQLPLHAARPPRAIDETCSANCSGRPVGRSARGPASASARAGTRSSSRRWCRPSPEAGSLDGKKGATGWRGRLTTLALPGTVQAVLAARIDRLEEREKRVLQTAAVIGKELHRADLAPCAPDSRGGSGRALEKLVAGEFLYEAGALSGAGVHLQARPHAGGDLQFASQGAAPDAPRAGWTSDRRPFRGSARRASEPTRASLLPQSQHREGDRVFTTGGGACRTSLGECGGHQPPDHCTEAARDATRHSRARTTGARPADRPGRAATTREGICLARSGQGVRSGAGALSAGGGDTRADTRAAGALGILRAAGGVQGGIRAW